MLLISQEFPIVCLSCFGNYLLLILCVTSFVPLFSFSPLLSVFASVFLPKLLRDISLMLSLHSSTIFAVFVCIITIFCAQYTRVFARSRFSRMSYFFLLCIQIFVLVSRLSNPLPDPCIPAKFGLQKININHYLLSS